METAAAVSRLPERLRARRLEREFERLRPLGEAYLLRRFNGQISRADAEDAVAEVLARLHRRIDEGQAPDNLRAVFFTAARNAAIDLLRSRQIRPTAPLEAAASAVDEGALPAERAESRENAVRLQEMLARMHGKYGEAIVLRFGLGLSVPQIAEHLEISLPAAKKLMLRATRQAKERLLAIEGAQFCPEMRALARRSLLEKQASGLASEAEAEVLRSHFAHCGACRSFLASLRDTLHELGAVGLAGLASGDRLGQAGAFEQVGHWLGATANGLETGAEKARQLALRASGALSSGEGAAGALVGTGQKVAAICGAATAATATCLITGAVGPGLGASPPPSEHEQRQPAPRVNSAPARAQAPEPAAPPPAAEPGEPPGEPSLPAAPTVGTEEAAVAPESSPAVTPPQAESPPPSEFGVEGGQSGAPSSQASPPPDTEGTAGSTGGEFGGGGTGQARSAGSAGIGFQG
jgi:RNA polymerase sigma factor (sigma-70 family)